MLTREELMQIKARVGALKPQHQKIRALSGNAYRICAFDVALLVSELEWINMTRDANGKATDSTKSTEDLQLQETAHAGDKVRGE
jgi:hypothetical protein